MEGQHEALIDRQLFEKCHEVRTRRRSKPRSMGEMRRVYLFSGLACFNECGLKLRCQSTSSKGKWRYYRHTADVRGYECSMPGKLLRADRLEKQWHEIITRIHLPEDWRHRIELWAGNEDEREAIRRERNYFEERLRRLARLYMDQLIDDLEYRESKETLKSKLRSLVLPDQSRLISAGAYLDSLEELWGAASKEERRDITQAMVEAFFVDVKSESIKVIQPVQAFGVMLKEICEDLGDEIEVIVGN